MNRQKKQYRCNDFIASERAVSITVGFVILVGILITAFGMVMATSLPFWTKTFEAEHASAVADEFCDLATEINGTITVAKEGGQNTAGTSVIKMKPDRVPIIGISPPGSCLEVRPDSEQLNITPYVGASPTTTVYNLSWIENTTADFSNNTKNVSVDLNFDTIKLSRVDNDNRYINDTTTSLTGVHYYDTVEIRNSTVYLIPNKYLKLYANTIYIDATSKLIADECGYLGGDGGNLGAGPGFGRYGYNGSGGGGAGHNGTGGAGGLGGATTFSEDKGAHGFSYGDNTSLSFVLGSGGAGGGCGEGSHGASHQGEPGGYGGNGGGAVLLNAQQINVHGNISANGAAGSDGIGADDPSGGGGGGGSGGIIIIQGDEVNMSSATLSANGGAGGTGGVIKAGYGGGGGGGGAGGRIKIFYNASLYSNPALSCTLVGGTGGTGGTGNKGDGETGTNGTAGIFHANQTAYDSEAFYEDSGYYESRVYDTGNATTCYGNISWYGNTTDYTSITVKVRTSIHEEMDGGNATLWPNCDAVANGQNLTDLKKSVFDCQQYIQYRVELSTYDTTQTPVFSEICINYFSSDPAGGSPVVAESSGAIKFTGGHIYYPKQALTYEHGAVIKSQNVNGEPQGLFIQPPPINITNQTSPTINISMIDLTGSSDSYSGTATASLENAYKTYDSFSTKFNNLTLNLSTEYPTIWGKWFNDTLEESDLTPQFYNVTVNETYVATEFYGHGAGVQLNVDKAVIAVSL